MRTNAKQINIANKLEKNKPGRGEQRKVKSVEHSMFGRICVA